MRQFTIHTTGLESLVHQAMQGVSCGKNHGENEECSSPGPQAVPTVLS